MKVNVCILAEWDGNEGKKTIMALKRDLFAELLRKVSLDANVSVPKKVRWRAYLASLYEVS